MDINKKYLAGVVIAESNRKVVKENGENKTVFSTEERDATPDDVLAIRETDSEMIFVTSDGQKYTRALLPDKK